MTTTTTPATTLRKLRPVPKRRTAFSPIDYRFAPRLVRSESRITIEEHSIPVYLTSAASEPSLTVERAERISEDQRVAQQWELRCIRPIDPELPHVFTAELYFRGATMELKDKKRGGEERASHQPDDDDDKKRPHDEALASLVQSFLLGSRIYLTLASDDRQDIPLVLKLDYVQAPPS